MNKAISHAAVVALSFVAVAAWPHDGAGLSEPFLYPTNPTPGGTVRSVLSFGAIAGDALDDTAAFNAAMTASSAGDTVFIPNGNYRLESTVLVKAGVSLIGESMAGVRLGTNFPVKDSAIHVQAGRNNLELSNFTVHKAGGADIQECILVGNAGSLTVTSQVKIERVTVLNFTNKGISLRSTRHCLITECIAGDAAAFGGGGEGYGFEIGGRCDGEFNDNSHLSNNNWIRCSEVRLVEAVPPARACRHGILLQYWTNHNLVETSLVEASTEDAFDLHGENEHHNEIRYCRAVDSEGAGFGLGNPCSSCSGCQHDDTGDYNWLHHCEVVDSAIGVLVMLGTGNTLIEHCLLENGVGTTSRGIHIRDESVLNPGEQNVGTIIRSNTIRNFRRGIEMANGPGTEIDGNAIYDNTQYGVFVTTPSTGWTLTNNYIACNPTNVSFGANAPAANTGNVTTCGTAPAPPPPLPSCNAEPEFAVTPSSLSFGTVEAGGGSATLSSVLDNLGSANLTVATTLADNGGGAFSIVATPAGTLLPGTSTTLTIHFAPTAYGATTGNVQIVTNDDDETTVTLALSGFGGDSVAPDSAVTAPNGNIVAGTGIFNVDWNGSDNAGGSGLANVKLFYRRNGGSIQQYGVFATSPVSFNSNVTGGDGTYEFYTVAEDVAGNEEAAPTVADVTVGVNVVLAVKDWTIY